MFDNLLFTHLTYKYVHLLYLTLSENFNVIPSYSWGFAVLVLL